jgi:hypothetical protein
MMDNLLLKLTSLGLAGLLWFVIAGEKTAETAMEIAVELRNVPQDLVLLDEPLHHVRIRVRASPGILQSLDPAHIYALIDLSGVGEGQRLLHLTPESIEIPFGVDVVAITPSTMPLRFERTLERAIDVRPRLEGTPAEGYEVAEVVCEPAQVRISGPRTHVAAVNAAFTEPVSIHETSLSITAVTKAGLDDRLLRIVGNRKVRVTARIRERQADRLLEGVTLELRGSSGTIRPPQVDVLLRGPAKLLDSLAREDVLPFVDALEPPAGGEATVHLALPPRFRALEVIQMEPAGVVIDEGKE